VSKAQKIERFRLSLATRLSLLGRIAAKADQPGLVRVQRQSEREDGEVLFHPDEAVVTAIKSLFERFAETGSARRVWLWFRTEGVKFPLQMHEHAEIRWVEASYHAIHRVLTNPVYAGAYVYGKTRAETTLDASGARKKRMRHLPREQWQVLIKEHHQGYIDWSTYEANQTRIAKNTRPRPHNDPGKSGGAVREGGALLQGIASCGHCGRRLRTHYSGRNSAPGYHCGGEHLVNGRGSYCLNIGGVQIDEAVARAFIVALEPIKLAATVAAAERLEADREATLKQWRLGVERANYEASRAERRYRAVDPDNRLVARGLEREWEESLRALEAARVELARREAARPRVLSEASASACSRSAQISTPCGMHRRLHHATARSCSEHCSKKLLSKSSATSTQRMSQCAGRAVR
jgi:Recombinase/Recombinase zinc beta ribbon domain